MSLDVSAIIIALLGALGGGTLATIFKHVWDWTTGKADRKRDEVDRAWAERDSEAKWRRMVEESLSLHRRIIIENIGSELLPPYPSRPTRDIHVAPKKKESTKDE